MGIPWCSDSKESACNARDPGSIPGSGRSKEWQLTPVILAWIIPWTEEPVGLQSVELQSRTQLSNFHRYLSHWFLIGSM